MHAVISGRAGKALVLDGESLTSFDTDDASNHVPRRPSDLHYLFGESQDLRVIENSDIESISRELKADTDLTLALDLTLISLDKEFEEDIRKDAIQDLDDMLTDDQLGVRLENILYARPLPEDGDLAGAFELCDELAVRNTRVMLFQLRKRQPLIADVSEAWDIIPMKIFGSHDRRTEFQRVAVYEGMFRRFVFTIEALGRVVGFVTHALLNDSIKQLPEHFEVLQAWEGAYREIAKRRDPTRPARGFSRFLGESSSLAHTLRVARAIAASDASVFLVGEAGTGKDLLARAIHEESHRRSRPFITINCGAIPADLIESELFGHARGAFTSADRDSRGLLEEADHGTVFLDEITEFTPSIQVKLLRVLQERAIRRVGSNRTLLVDVRVLAASSRNVEKEVEAGRFRRDLFYRLNVVPIVLPPLRERPEDIHLLAVHFLKKAAEKYNRRAMELDPKLILVFAEYAWPGNVRELENVIERLVVLSSGSKIGLELLPRGMLAPPDRNSAFDVMRDEGVREFERRYVGALLQRVGGNKVAAARLLGIKKSDLLKLIDRFGLRTTRDQPRTGTDPSDI